MIFLDDVDRWRYLAMLGDVVVRMRWRCLSYCLMPNHVHLLVQTPDANLGAGMHRLHGRYAQKLNERHGRCGHVFQGRYGAKRVRSDAQLWMTARYLARNPVEGGLTERPEDWRWSSHAAVVSGRAPSWLDVGMLLAYFVAAGGDGRERYVDFVGI